MHSIGDAGDVARVEVADRKLALTMIQPDEVRRQWEYISGHLQRILRKTREKWIPEDIYAALMSGNSACMIVTDDGEKAGLLIVRREIEDFSGIPYLFVWCVSLKNTDFDLALAELRKFADSVGVKSIRGESPRPGWMKRARLLSATYEFEV